MNNLIWHLAQGSLRKSEAIRSMSAFGVTHVDFVLWIVGLGSCGVPVFSLRTSFWASESQASRRLVNDRAEVSAGIEHFGGRSQGAE